MLFVPGLRGCTANVIVLEEAAFIDPQVFFQVVVPLMGVRHTAVLAITSPDDEFNYFSEVIELKNEHDQPLFHSIKIGLMCDSCQQRGVAKCPHRIHRLPHWKSAERQRKVEAIMAGDEKLMLRETRGMIVGSRNFVFQPDWLDVLYRKPLYSWQMNVQWLSIGIDPSGGGGSAVGR